MLTELIFGSPAAPRLRHVCLIAAGFAVQSCWPGANPGSRPTDAVCFHGLLPARGPSLSKGHRAASDNRYKPPNRNFAGLQTPGKKRKIVILNLTRKI